MAERLELQALLSGIEGVKKAYFQEPPANMMEYPCIVYSVDNRNTAFANNLPYRSIKRYQVTVIDENPDSKIPDAVAALPTSTFSTRFKASNLNHEVYSIYF
jgi:hypothetical protein